MTELVPRHVRRQLAALRREQAGEAGGPVEPAVPAPRSLRPEPPHRLVLAAPESLPPALEVAGEGGVCWSFRLAPEQAHPELRAWLQAAAQEIGEAAAGVARRHAALYLDLETLGFAGVPLFLVGMLHAGPQGFHVHQFLARDYSEEAAVLEACRLLLEQAQCLVTYNGRTFDWPFLIGRYHYHRLPPPAQPAHVDLLPIARRLHRGRLPDCSLSTVEEYVLGVERVGDVPSSAIPDLYHRAVAEEDLQLLAPVLYHNQVDLLSLVCLAGRWREHL
jgi:uncharacterized protein YprB with RNaseH-like and TPR domain